MSSLTSQAPFTSTYLNTNNIKDPTLHEHIINNVRLVSLSEKVEEKLMTNMMEHKGECRLRVWKVHECFSTMESSTQDSGSDRAATKCFSTMESIKQPHLGFNITVPCREIVLVLISKPGWAYLTPTRNTHTVHI